MNPILDCVHMSYTCLPIVCIPENYKALQERISRSSRNQSFYSVEKTICFGIIPEIYAAVYWLLPNPTSVGYNMSFASLDCLIILQNVIQ